MITLTPAERAAIVSSVSSSLLKEGREAYHTERVEEMIRDLLPSPSYTAGEVAADLPFEDERERKRITASILEEVQERIVPAVIYREKFGVYVSARDEEGEEIDRQDYEAGPDYEDAHRRAREETRDYFHPGNDGRWRRWVVDSSKRRRSWEPAIREVSIGISTERVDLSGDPIPDGLDLPSYEEEEEIRIRRDLLKEVEEIENYIHFN